ncbi:MAG: hypothetical protein ACK4IX_08990 [Candidatus Sericytochromatia bacterium]
MKKNSEALNLILKIVDNQLKDNNPKETKLTLNRLVKEGYSTIDAKKLIAQCLLIELNRAVNLKETFNLKVYTQNLENLPKEPS